MSIQSIRAVQNAQAGALSGTDPAGAIGSGSFGELLRRQLAGGATQRGVQQVDVRAALASARDRAADEARRMSVAHLAPENMVDVAGAEASHAGTAAGAIWTASADPSDSAYEKAAPYMGIIQEASAAYGVPCNVIMGVIRAESDFNEKAVSFSGAKGLMQIMPCTEQQYGVSDPFDARQNIFCGTHELADNLNRFGGDLRVALAAYNTGPTRVARLGVTSSNDASYLAIPSSVRAYADRVLRYAGLSA